MHRINSKQKDFAFHEWLTKLDWDSLNVEFPVNELLQEMVQNQLPLPTPLHPKAVPKYASRDSCPVAWFRDERRSRRDNQRLLKLVQTDERILDIGPFSKKLGQDKSRGRGSKGARSRRTHRVGVIARQFRTADGTILSRPSLQRRVDVDDQLVRLSQIVLQKSSGVANDPTYVCRLNWNSAENESYSLLDLLMIASCGNFGCRPFVAGRCDVDFLVSVDSWLDPFQRWFTLGQYLAFCYEVSLRNMYHESQRGPVVSAPLEADEFYVDTEEAFTTWICAVWRAFRKLLEEEAQGVLPFMRDSIIASCLLDPIDQRFKTYHRPSEFSCFPLVDLGAPIGHWKALIHNEWLVVRSIRAEAALLKDNDMSDDTNVMANTSSAEVKSSKAKKSKRKKKVRSRPEPKAVEINNNTDLSQSSEEEDVAETQIHKELSLNPVFDDASQQIAVDLQLSLAEQNNADGFQVVTKGKRTPSQTTMRQPTKSTEPFFRRETSTVNTQAKGGTSSFSEGMAALDSADTSLFPHLRDLPDDAFKPDPTATLRISNTSTQREEVARDFPLSDILPGYNGDNWILTDFSHFGFGGGWHRETNRGESILTELLDGQSKFDRDEERIASSTAASIASSLEEEAVEVLLTDAPDICLHETQALSDVESASEHCLESEDTNFLDTASTKIVDAVPNLTTPRSSAMSEGSPSPPSTPSPTLSPILVSLSDLSTMNKHSITSFELGQSSLCSDPTAKKVSTDQAGSKSGMSHGAKPLYGKNSLQKHDFKDCCIGVSRSFHTRSSRARDDGDIHHPHADRNDTRLAAMYRRAIVRSESARDDTEVRVRVNLENSDFNATAKKTHHISPERPPRYFHIDTISNSVGNGRMKICTSRSETALENDEAESNDWHSKATRDFDDVESNSLVSPQHELTAPTGDDFQGDQEQLRALREEKNMFQDMCLTLGAEVAKLRSILAAQAGVFAPPSSIVGFQPKTRYSTVGGQQFDLPFMPESFPIAPRARTMVAMSDVGNRADTESMAGADDDVLGKMQTQDPRHVSSGATVAESDASLDPSTVYNIYQMPIGIQSVREIQDPIAPHGVRSRLSDDIIQFLENIEEKLRKLEPKRQMAIERMTRLVKSVWPRAQVNLYGSHATRLCIPGSDLDFVVCLPAVHKNAVAVAPGVLEGRNAINESSQKILARRLKGESWIDPRSMKIIERTVTPVIKVATKETKAKSLHLDISFEAPGHHGLEAARMISSVIEEIPHVRPLCLVLKQFLLDRGLLEAYTGGLSSYCLFLMVTRYLQEQSNLDVGSLLMGFLDFYGNHVRYEVIPSETHPVFVSLILQQLASAFDIDRPHYYATVGSSQPVNSWRPHATPSIPVGETQMLNASHRRKSFSDRQNIDRMRDCNNSVTGGQQGSTAGSLHGSFCHGILNVGQQNTTMQQHQSTPMTEGSQAMPYTFDPLFVEDPLSDGNNVGRNAFRIFQIQRAFSDAHRALVAALEWDMQSANEEARALPLLKCLFQNEEQAYN